MNCLLILYNPYYQKDVIEQHLKILLQKGEVAFGKLDKLSTMKQDFEEDLKAIYESTSEENPLQLFLSDYANLFVAKVSKISTEDLSKLAPSYYKQKKLKVKDWFLIKDLRELVRDDFKLIRDNFLANFLVPSTENSTFALYGNNYVYPLIIKQKQEENYFLGEKKHYLEVFQNEEYLKIKQELSFFGFEQKDINTMLADTLHNIISAELDFRANKDNPLYDLSSAIIKYSKSLEQEMRIVMSLLVRFLARFDQNILQIRLFAGAKFVVGNLEKTTASYAAYKQILSKGDIESLIQSKLSGNMKRYFSYIMFEHIDAIQKIRNHSAHAGAPKHEDFKKLRKHILGIGKESIVIELMRVKQKLFDLLKKL
ncbi:ATP-binding protein [Campylobacter sp. MIT 12-5580]|uniref:HP0729 family protein n=1 Tax=Campylobacter sp. MIT 12-5580 TaxID=2040651 RepID=UPI0010F5E68C|nr:HP0729 family protein [Campylobacter sp. MIT 12-5580]TKX30275.1 ATP-binding protein [Campylobacter sp. MIT 12-5580]